MPKPSDGSPKALFNLYKSRAEGGDVAAFTLENDGTLQIYAPDRAKSMNPQKLKAQLKGKGVAGFFYKGSTGPVFNVVAGKQGATQASPGSNTSCGRSWRWPASTL